MSNRVTGLPNVRLVREVVNLQSTSTGYEYLPVSDPSEGDAANPVTHSYGDWRQATAENATHAILDLTTWSDYSGSTIERSNERSLLRDYPGTFIRLYGGYGTSGLMIPVDMPKDWRADYDDTPEERWESLLDELTALGDYPVYDEDDLSALEIDLEFEAWDSYLQFDVPRDLESRGVPEDTITGQLDRIRERFYAITREQDHGPEPEGADNVTFPFYEQTLDIIAGELTT